MNLRRPAGHSLATSLAGMNSTQSFSNPSLASRLAPRLPRQRVEIHVCESDGERSLHSLRLHLRAGPPAAAGVVDPPGVQGTD